MQTLRLPQSVHFAERAKDERSLIRDKRLKKEWKKFKSGETEAFLYEAESKRRGSRSVIKESERKVKGRRFNTSTALTDAAFFIVK